MRHLYSLALLLVLGLCALQSASAQQSLLLTFPDTPCDSMSCGQLLTISPPHPQSPVRVTYGFRDGAAYRLDSAVLGSESLPAGQSITVPVCFRPTRRGQISDSLVVVVTSGALSDTFRIRVTGKGIGPELEPTPVAVNFPKTDVGTTSTRSIVIRNIGERPYTFDAASISVPAPYQLGTPGPLEIAPGGTVAIDMIFAPTVAGVYSYEAVLRAGCARQLELELNGATELVGTGSVLRLSKLRFNPVNDEEAPCSVSRCTEVTISNAGNAPLTVEDIRWALDTAGYRITSMPAFPLLIAPNDQHTFEICLEGRWRGRLIDTLVVTSNSRASIAFGIVLDYSQSMEEELDCGAGFRPTRFAQALSQAQRFIGRTLLHLPAVDIQDHLAIMRYSYVEEIRMLFPQQPVTEPLKTAAQNTLNGQRPSSCRFRQCTYTGEAVSRMIDTLRTSPLQKRVLVLLSDGEATDDSVRGFYAEELAARARSLGITIFTIGLGVPDGSEAAGYLQRMARATGGEAYISNDCGSLQEAFEAITVTVSRGHETREPFAMRVTAPMVITSGDLAFDSTYYGTTRCGAITLTNVGEGDVVIDEFELLDALGATSGEFTIGESVTFPLTIRESAQLPVEICFRPNGLRQRGGATRFSFNSCQPLVIGSQLTGTGWARAGMRIDDERVGLPGTIATMPVHLDSTLAAYEVGTVSFQVRWNKSMLDLRAVRPLEAMGTGAVSLVGPVRFEGRDAVADFVATGDFLTPAGALAELEFLVLRGDSLASTVSLAALTFEDDNPKPLMKNAGMVAFDSTCFRDGKAIVFGGGAAAKLVAVDAAPVPALRGTPIVVTMRSDGVTSVHVSLYSATGALAIPAAARALAGGEERLTLPTESLAPGAYYLHIEDGSGATHVRSVVVAE